MPIPHLLATAPPMLPSLSECPAHVGSPDPSDSDARRCRAFGLVARLLDLSHPLQPGARSSALDRSIAWPMRTFGPQRGDSMLRPRRVRSAPGADVAKRRPTCNGCEEPRGQRRASSAPCVVSPCRWRRSAMLATLGRGISAPTGAGVQRLLRILEREDERRRGPAPDPRSKPVCRWPVDRVTRTSCCCPTAAVREATP